MPGQAKLTGLLGYLDRNCSFILLRMEETTAHPEQTLERILQSLTHSAPEASAPLLTDPFKPVLKRLGSKFKPAVDNRPETPKTLSPDDMQFLRSQVHPEQEAALGYSYESTTTPASR